MRPGRLTVSRSARKQIWNIPTIERTSNKCSAVYYKPQHHRGFTSWPIRTCCRCTQPCSSMGQAEVQGASSSLTLGPSHAGNVHDPNCPVGESCPRESVDESAKWSRNANDQGDNNNDNSPGPSAGEETSRTTRLVPRRPETHVFRILGCPWCPTWASSCARSVTTSAASLESGRRRCRLKSSCCDRAEGEISFRQ